MVVVLGLALLSQITIGLDAVLEAVELCVDVSKFAQWRSGTRCCPLDLRFLGDFQGFSSVYSE
jgi:hypothetical protein